jgi:S1-C subfamily serine protease
MTPALILVVASAAAAPQPDPEPWLESVVLLTTGASICAGALIDDQGTVATAYHCVASGRRPRVETRGGEGGVGRVIAASPRDDLALVRVEELAGRAFLEIRADDLDQGEAIWALGHPFGGNTSPLFDGLLRWSVSSGVVSAVGGRLTQVDAPMNPGNSGGPLVDSEGRVAGIASRKLKADNIAFMSPASSLRELVEEPEPARTVFGGQVAPAVSLSVPFPLDTASAAGGGLEIWLRDTVGVSGLVYAPLGANWLALQRGSVRWVASEAKLAGRVRIGRGALSTTLDLGGGVMAIPELVGAVEEDEISLRRGAAAITPMGFGRVGLSGFALRWTALPSADGELEVWLGVDVSPGTLFVF